MANTVTVNSTKNINIIARLIKFRSAFVPVKTSLITAG